MTSTPSSTSTRSVLRVYIDVCMDEAAGAGAVIVCACVAAVG